MVDKGRAEEHINDEILEISELRKSIEVTDPYKHLYDTLDLHCWFGGSAQNRVASCFTLNAPLSEEKRSIPNIHAFTRVG